MCILQKDVTLQHLFFKYAFAKNCPSEIDIVVPSMARSNTALRIIKRSLGLPFAMEIIITMCWSIWIEWNAWIFINTDPSTQL
jgi:hypothetical protein